MIDLARLSAPGVRILGLNGSIIKNGESGQTMNMEKEGKTPEMSKMISVNQTDHDAMATDNRKLREMLWIYHGHSIQGLYGDDGERQCSKCMIDFNRDSVDNIAHKLAHSADIPL